jgi:hypothetical protein
MKRERTKRKKKHVGGKTPELVNRMDENGKTGAAEVFVCFLFTFSRSYYVTYSFSLTADNVGQVGCCDISATYTFAYFMQN